MDSPLKLLHNSVVILTSCSNHMVYFLRPVACGGGGGGPGASKLSRWPFSAHRHLTPRVAGGASTALWHAMHCVRPSTDPALAINDARWLILQWMSSKPVNDYILEFGALTTLWADIDYALRCYSRFLQTFFWRNRICMFAEFCVHGSTNTHIRAY